MAKLVLFLAVSLVLQEFAVSIEDKEKTCKCDLPYNREKQAPWMVSIHPIMDDYLTAISLTMNGLILSEKWVLATWESGCFLLDVVRPSVGLEVKLDGHSGCTKNQIKGIYSMRLKDLGESMNYTRDEIFLFELDLGEPMNDTRYEFFLFELATPIDLGDHGNASASFQPGCFLQETRKATEFLYDNLSTTGLIGDVYLVSFRGEFTFADVSNNRSECAKDPEKLICLKYLGGPNTTVWYQTDINSRLMIYLNTPLYHQVDGKRLIVATLGRDEDNDYPNFRTAFYYGSFPANNPFYPYPSEHPIYLSNCGNKLRDLEEIIERLSFFRVSSFLDRIQEHVGDDLCLFERKPDDSVCLVSASDHPVDRL